MFSSSHSFRLYFFFYFYFFLILIHIVSHSLNVFSLFWDSTWQLWSVLWAYSCGMLSLSARMLFYFLFFFFSDHFADSWPHFFADAHSWIDVSCRSAFICCHPRTNVWGLAFCKSLVPSVISMSSLLSVSPPCPASAHSPRGSPSMWGLVLEEALLQPLRPRGGKTLPVFNCCSLLFCCCFPRKLFNFLGKLMLVSCLQDHQVPHCSCFYLHTHWCYLGCSALWFILTPLISRGQWGQLVRLFSHELCLWVLNLLPTHLVHRA